MRITLVGKYKVLEQGAVMRYEEATVCSASTAPVYISINTTKSAKFGTSND